MELPGTGRDQVSGPGEQSLGAIKSLIEEGRYLTAWKEAEPFGPLRAWHGCERRNIAARLAGSLGDIRLREALYLCNARQYPADDDAFLGGIFHRIRRRGPISALEQMEARLATHLTMARESRADLLAFKGRAHGMLRDFEFAHRAVDESLALAPESYWPRLQKSAILELEDRYEEALQAARETLAMVPGKPSAVLQLADCLIHCGLDDEAIALLEQAHQCGEASWFAERLVNLFSEREDHQRALHFLDEHDRRAPLLDKAGRKWSDRRRADFLYMAGDFAGCLAYCDKLAEPYHAKIAKKMRQPDALTLNRKRLNVPFVRQHNMTCAPATMAALAAYWGLHFDHLRIADAICYDGTPWHKERAWAEANGFCAAEFRLTHPILVALIDRGVPFTLSTESVAGGHLQACIGYDDRQGVALLRDPTERHFGEVFLDGLIEDHPVLGPRCMLMLPHREIERIAGLILPDAEVYDAYHRLSCALDDHDRATARAALDSMPEAHPMKAFAELRFARYDRNPAAQLQILDALVERFPANAPLRHSRLWALQRMNDPARERQVLREELQRANCDPVFYSEMGEMLLRDARNLPLADYYLRKAARLQRGVAQVYSSLAFCRWKERRFEEAARYRRVAACLNEGGEGYAAAYAEACRIISRSEEGVAFLRRRVQMLGKKNSGAWSTLADELNAQHRTAEAMAVLEEGMAARVDDGAMMMASGRKWILWGERERGKDLMARARGKVHEAEWQCEMAKMCGFLGEREKAIGHWREFLRLEPYSVEGYRAIAGLLADEGGTDKALEVLGDATALYPQFPELWSLKAEWDAMLGPAAAIPTLEKARALDPDSLWILRELAVQRSRSGDREEALREIGDALCKDPHSSVSHRILANILESDGRVSEARTSYENAVRLSVDDTAASSGLVTIAPNALAKLAALQFIESEMRRQVSDGTIVSEYRSLAYPHLEPDHLLGQLRGFCDDRPDLWQTWAARVEQASDMGLSEEALRCAQTLTERFPLLPRAWVELASVHHEAGGYEAEVAALRRAVDLSPAWDWAARKLAEVLERTERYDEALEVLERALHHEPLVGANHGCLADLLWKLGRREQAFERLLQGMRNCPSYGWGWTTLAEWAQELKREADVVSALDVCRRNRAHLAEWWCKVADVLDSLGRTEEGIEAIETGLRQHPDDLELLEQKAYLLATVDRFDEALAACERGLERAPGDRHLSGRQAWVQMQMGKPNEAIRQMSALLEHHPDYLWAIRQLSGWLYNRQRWGELRDLSLKWVRQAPQSSYAYGSLANAERNLENRDAAKKAFAKAFALDPENAYPGRHLISYQIEDDELEAAEETLRTLEHYASSAMITADAIELAVAKKDRAEANRRAGLLLLRSDTTIELLKWMKDLFAKGGWEADWWKRLDAEALGPAAPSKPVLEAWIHSLPSRGKIRKGVRRLERLPMEQEEIKAHGWVTLFDSVDKSHSRKIRRWIRKHRKWFRTRTDLWAAAGGALTDLGDYKGAAKWLADWESRGKEVPCDALFNLGVSIETVRGWQAAAHVREVALQRYPSHSLSPSLRVTVALQTLLGGDGDYARVLGAEVEADKLSQYYGGYFSLYNSLIAAEEGDYETAASHYSRALRVFNEFNGDYGIESFFTSAVERLATLVPWAKGRPAKIRRGWGRYKGVPLFGGNSAGLRWWPIAWLIFFAIHAFIAMMRK